LLGFTTLFGWLASTFWAVSTPNSCKRWNAWQVLVGAMSGDGGSARHHPGAMVRKKREGAFH